VTRNGVEARLTPTEFDLLYRLARAPRVVFGRARLLEEVWGHKVPAGERTVDSHVRSIRRKLGAGVVRTVHGVGYAFDPDVTA
jgi:DNA-binding response OmpR family regulator